MRLPTMTTRVRGQFATAFDNRLEVHTARARNHAMIAPANGVCYATRSPKTGECIYSGGVCVEGSPEVYETTYMGQKICGCRCVK